MERPEYLKQLIDKQDNGMIKIITGMRRSGKTYLLFELFYKYLLSSGVNPNNIIAIAFDDLRNEHLRNPHLLLNYIEDKVNDSNKYYLLLDEVQFIDRFQDVLNSFLHFKNVDTFATGSNAKFLSKDIITEFRGRGDQIYVQPLNFREYIEGSGLGKESAIKDYLTYGGLPYLIHLNSHKEKQQYLKDLITETYLIDVVQRNNLFNTNELEKVLQIAASCIGSLINPNKIAAKFNTVNSASIHNNTIAKYLDLFEDAFILNKVCRFDVKGRKYIGTPFKFYFTDIGIRNACLNFRQIEPSHIMENCIFNELINRGYSVDVGNVKTSFNNKDNRRSVINLEIDFVCNLASKRLYIQSAYSMPVTEKRQQEERPLLKVNDQFKKIIITNDDVIKHYDENGVLIINFMDFLLDKNSLDY